MRTESLLVLLTLSVLSSACDALPAQVHPKLSAAQIAQEEKQAQLLQAQAQAGQQALFRYDSAQKGCFNAAHEPGYNTAGEQECTLVSGETGNFGKAKLRGSLIALKARKADFRDADLRDTSFQSDCSLEQTGFSGADLQDADLGEGSFDNSDLRGACLLGADLSRANLGSTNLNGAYFSSTTKLPFPEAHALSLGMISINEHSANPSSCLPADQVKK